MDLRTLFMGCFYISAYAICPGIFGVCLAYLIKSCSLLKCVKLKCTVTGVTNRIVKRSERYLDMSVISYVYQFENMQLKGNCTISKPYFDSHYRDVVEGSERVIWVDPTARHEPLTDIDVKLHHWDRPLLFCIWLAILGYLSIIAFNFVWQDIMNGFDSSQLVYFVIPLIWFNMWIQTNAFFRQM